MILLDSNSLIHYLKGIEPLTSRLQNISGREVAIPAVVMYELEYGTLKSRNPRRRLLLGHVLRDLDVIPFDGPAAEATAEIRVSLEALGHSIGPMDLLIAGTAVSRGATLVTNNIREFARIRTLRIEDWTA